MNQTNPEQLSVFGRREYNWLSIMYISYSVCVLALLFIVPLETEMSMLILILMTLVYLGALGGLSVRALKRIEKRLEQLQSGRPN